MDAKTIDAARRGQQDAQAELLREFQDLWFRLACSLLGNADQAHDATQETAMRFLKQLPNFRGNSQLKTWATGIALNVIRESRRDAMKQRLLKSNYPAEQSFHSSAADQVATRDQLSALRDKLASLPQRQREVVVLRYFEQMSVEETAAVMNCAAGTVKATLFQALRSLRDHMNQVSVDS